MALIRRNLACLFFVAMLAIPKPGLSQEPTEIESAIEALTDRLNEQEEVIYELQARLYEYESTYSGLEPGECNLSCKPKVRRLPVVAEETVPPCSRASDTEFHVLPFYADYDKGFALLPYDEKKTPFNMRINGWIQFRHAGFARRVEEWTDNAGNTRAVRNRNAFDIERARLYFKGNALDKRLSYFYHLDADTDGRHGVDFFDYWWAWDFTDRFRVQLGKRKVTASRQWLLGARRTRLADRPMAADFFRPDRTVGLYAIGRTGECGHYELMVGNGYRTANVPNIFTDDQFTYAATQYFDPFGDFGGQIVDYDYNCDPLLRIGHSFVYSPVTSEELGVPNLEADFIRLSDGTRLSIVGALAPNVTVSGLDIYFYSVDLAMKWRGWSFTTEVFLRWLEQLEADGPIPHSELMQRGFFVEGGKFLVPKKLETNFRYSSVSGLFADRSEYGAGVGWYPLDTHKMKINFDVSVYDGSPLQNTASDINVGDDGVLFRTQFQAEF